MRARAFVAASALVTATTLLAACGGSSGDSDTAKGGGTAGGGGKVTLKFQSLAFQAPTIAATKKIVADWNKSHPKVQVQYVQGNWDSVHDQLVTQFQGGSAPDIFHDESADIAGFAKQGFLADLSPHLSAATKSSIAPGIWKTVTADGKVVAGPTLLQSYVVFANTDLLKKAGIAVPTGKSMSWTDFRAMAKKLTAGGTYGLGWGLKQPTATVLSMGLNFGGQYFTGTGSSAKVVFGAPERQLPQQIHDMAYVDKSLDPGSISQGGGDILPAFYAGKYAMTVQGNYAAQQIISDAKKTFHWTVLPPLAGTSANQAANPQTLSVSAQSKHVKEAAQFVDYSLQAERLAAVAQGDWLIPTSSSARAAVAKATGGKSGWAATLASGDNLTEAPFQTVEKYPQWKDQIATPALQQYFANKISLDELGTKFTSGWAQVGGS